MLFVGNINLFVNGRIGYVYQDILISAKNIIVFCGVSRNKLGGGGNMNFVK